MRRTRTGTIVGFAVLTALFASFGAAQAATPQTVSLPRTPLLESENNGTTALADKLASGQRIRGMIWPAADVDFYTFTAKKNARVFAMTMTSASASGTDTVLELIRSDGTTVVEADDSNGTLAGTASSISGAVIPATGKYYLKVSGTGTIRPYDLFLLARSGTAPAETEPNDATAKALPASGWVRGNLATAADVDQFTFPQAAAAMSFLSLDLDPERDATSTVGRLGFGPFATLVPFANDDGADGEPDSEALVTTKRTAGPRTAIVDGNGTGTGTYRLSVSTIAPERPKCRVYTNSTAAPIADVGLITSTITVPDSFVVGRAAVRFDIDHTFMADLDMILTTGAGSEIAVATDIGPVSTGAYHASFQLDDYAAAPIGTFPQVDGQILQPEPAGPLAHARGQQASGTWTLTVRDDAAMDTGTLNSWGLTLCAAPATPKSLGTFFATDFESGAAGFTHSGTQDEWELGLPTFAPITTCASGVTCWKTDLDNTYNASNSQDLISPSIALPAGRQAAVRWKHKFHMESANFDHYTVVVREVGGANPRTLYEWTGATMNATVGNPAVTAPLSAGWNAMRADISAYAGKNVEIVWHVDGDSAVHLGGVAVDDVRVERFDSKPPQTKITKKPGKRTSSTTAKFRFKSTEAGSKFQCKVDKGKFKSCKASFTKKNLKPGKHTLQVRAKDKAGNLDKTPAKFSWRVLA